MFRSIVLLLAWGVLAGAQEAPPAAAKLEDLRWFAGCWSGEMKSGGRFEECWTAPRAGSMQGSARITREGKTTFREFMLLEQSGDGVVMTVQHFASRMAPQGKPVSFALVRLNDEEAIFENPQHDHPQRIAYRKQADGSIQARIENLDGSRAVDFPMRRPR